jgi:hypothetical protein
MTGVRRWLVTSRTGRESWGIVCDDPMQGASAMKLTISIAILVAAIAGLPALPTLARDDGQWEGADPAIRAWFQSLKQPDHPRLSCCGEADAFEADTFEAEDNHYVAVITNGKGIIPNGTRIAVPNQKMKVDAGNPTGHGIIFIGTQGQIYCYVTPGGL